VTLFARPLMLLWGAICAGALIAAYYLCEARRRGLMSALGEPAALARLFPESAAARRALKSWLFIAAAALIFLALAGPQWGTETAQSDTGGAGQVVIAVDTSLSMLARDIKPSRMENAKLMLKLFIEQFSGYRMGLVAFSGQAYVQCPLTTDADALKYFLASVHPGMLPEPGTTLAGAVDMGTYMLARYPGRKALVLLTDGEDHAGSLNAAVKRAADSGVTILAVGIGSPEGDIIPAQGQDFMKDRSGRTVVSKLGEKALIDMAAATGGAYIRYTSPETAANAIASQLRKLEKSRWQGKDATRYKNRYQWPLALALLLLLIESVVPEGTLSLRRILAFRKGQ